MTKKRIVLLAAAMLAAALVWASGLPNLVAVIVDAGVYRSLYPQGVSWDSHGGYVKCAGAIAGTAPWPAAPQAACEAMNLCANAATLSATETKALDDAMKKTKGCGGM
jgi:hypothetical protein